MWEIFEENGNNLELSYETMTQKSIAPGRRGGSILQEGVRSEARQTEV